MRHLLVVANTAHDVDTFRNMLDGPRQQVHHFSPHTNPNRHRGLNEMAVAIVWLSTPALSEAHQRILDVYIGLGAVEFHHNRLDEIKTWLKGA